MEFTLPEGLNPDNIIRADLNMNVSLYNENYRCINVHKVTEEWTSSEITWNNKASYDSTVIDSVDVGGSVYDEFTWDITELVKDWYVTEENYGLLLKNENETVGYNQLYSSDTSTSYKPQVTINYQDYTINEIYDILGDDCTTLTDSQIENMNSWREKIVSEVRNDLYDNIYINGPIDDENLQIALTFDDGPNSYTDDILEILEEYDVQATFFLLGSNVVNNPILTKTIYDNGHLIGSHSYSHPELIDESEEEIEEELQNTEDAIYEITGKIPAIIRPPYGSVDTDVMDVLNDNGYSTIIWSTDSLDWANTNSSADNIVNNVVDNARSGEIVLMHDRSATVAALPSIISGLKEKGFEFVTVDELLGVTDYKN
jgi:polysaccharide deacetylase family sporulation protein PdaB